MTIPYQTIIPARAVDNDTLVSLVSSLSAAMNQVANVETMYVISTEDADFSSMLDTLAEGLTAGAASKSKPKTATKAKKSSKTEPTMSRASYRRIPGGEIVTTRQLNKDLANRNGIKPNDVFENHKGERFVALEDGGELRLVKEPRS